jgi:hypothetical protein
METKEKQMAAALAAVAAYMQMEEESFRQQLDAAMTPPAPTPAGGPNLWGQSGRQSMMQLRGLMQLKAFDRFR